MGLWADVKAGISEDIRESRRKIILWIMLPVVAVCLLYFGGRDLVPSWQAKLGNGTVGTFTAQRNECSTRSRTGKTTCYLHGSWVAADGSRRRDDVILYDGPSSLGIGGKTKAWDTGARKGVFGTSSGSTYLWITACFLGGLVALVSVVIMARRAVRNHRADLEYRARDLPGQGGALPP